MDEGALTVITPILPDRVDALDRLLTSMGDDVMRNPHIDFGVLTTVHFFRWVILPERRSELSDHTYPPQLVLSSCHDGPAEGHVAELVCAGRGGIDEIYRNCVDYPEAGDNFTVGRYLLDRAVDSSIFFVGMPGVTAPRVQEDARLRDAIEDFLDARSRESAHFEAMGPESVRDEVREFVANRPDMTRESVGPRPRRFPWYGWVLLVLVAIPLIPFLAVLLLCVRLREAGDENREAGSRESGPDPVRAQFREHVQSVEAREDVQVQNQLSHVVEVRPGWVRRIVLALLLPVLDFGARRIFNQGELLGVRTLHFVRWVRIDGGRRLMFLTNYDGSMVGYISDFVNRSWQIPSVLTAIWSNTLRFPPSRWLIGAGARDVPRFTVFLREHAVTTQLWYSAYKGVTAGNKRNNDLIRRESVEEIRSVSARDALRRF